MVCHVQTARETNGRWMAKVPAIPGLQIYGDSQDDLLASARKLTAILMNNNSGEEHGDLRILAFYPGRIPDSALLEARAL